jgi:hypothetical protein
MTPREIVRAALNFDHPPRVPRDLWTLPWTQDHCPDELAALRERFAMDVARAPDVHRPCPRAAGDPYAVGQYTDEWGCVFENVQAGIIGEVKRPILADIADWKSVQPPYDILPDNPADARDTVNRFCGQTDQFVLSGLCARPWERYQFLRGSAEAMMDVMFPEEGAADLLRTIHEFYLKDMAFWASTDVDAIMFMDDWGSQRQLLIPPAIWRELFAPLYRDYVQLAHAHGKAAFMHSDGHIQEILPDLAELGVDAINSQLFTMDLAELARTVKGRLTFWGEIDRQHVLPSGDPHVARDAVQKVAEHLYDPAGGVIAQCEFGPGANPACVEAAYDEWDRVCQG